MKKYYFTFVAFCFFSFVNGQIINFPDANFKIYLLASSPIQSIAKDLAGNKFKIDSNNDGEIQQNEALLVSSLEVSVGNLTNLIGIEYFLSLQNLDCSFNFVTSLNLSMLTNLQFLNCNNNQLTFLNISNCSNLKSLGCNYNSITNLNCSGLTLLQYLHCEYNMLTILNLNQLNALKYLSCSHNQLTNLDLTDSNMLEELYCYNNQLTNLNINGLEKITNIRCQYNKLTSIDVSDLHFLNLFYCFNNELINLFIKNGKNEFSLSFGGNPALKYVCADESQILDVQSKVNFYGYSSTCQINSYCTFTPGGQFYIFLGDNKFDNNNNGCDSEDVKCTNINYSISNEIYGSFISNNSGNYFIPVQSGTHTVTPILENPTYFNVLPTSATITFPATTSPALQDFCITANGVHNDLEIALLPVNIARPGFEASYKLVYKNKGNQTQSGSVSLTFYNAVLDFVNANPATTSQILNNLFWSFVDLKPFETREIAITLNANSPIEIPALIANDILPFTANVTSTNDETPIDNTAILNQTVFNSFDPNDKTCLEGNNIVPAKVGEYVHYMIRFENTGTFAAQNIVVKDIIDLAKFDIESLIPVKGSHDFYTRINGNKVEFIFENINLPFADATNDGYVAFKIKTKSTLVLGNTFSNSANIYFDYNFPIVTNTATTTIANSLANNDFDFSKYFNIYPNPAKNILNFETKSDLVISSLSIYNTLGQLVQIITSPNKTIDVSGLKSGNYFIKIISDKGTNTTKIIKE